MTTAWSWRLQENSPNKSTDKCKASHILCPSAAWQYMEELTANTYEQQRKGLKMGADVVIYHSRKASCTSEHGDMLTSQKCRSSSWMKTDRMLGHGIFDDIMQIINTLPKERQTLLFSATMLKYSRWQKIYYEESG